MKIEDLEFDSKLFGFSVGRLELERRDAQNISNGKVIQEWLRRSYNNGTKLVYLFCPTVDLSVDDGDVTFGYQVPGILVDKKTTFVADITQFSTPSLLNTVYCNDKIDIYCYYKEPKNSNSALNDLAVQSGAWSRFKVDSSIPNEGYEAMFLAWINNSVNRSLADEVFVARCKETGKDVGMITVKKKESEFNIGLLAVDPNYRRRNIAKMLLSRVLLWCKECSCSSITKISVVTQGSNSAACLCYEHFGFRKCFLQDIYHVWLPKHLIEPNYRADLAKIPYCKQYFTGKELEYVSEVLSSGLDSNGRFTLICAAKIQEILGKDCERTIVVNSGTAALEMAFLLINLQPGDEVILPSYTFSSTANSILLRDAVPVFVDIRADTLNIDEKLIESAITSRTRAICCVHYGGVPCEMDTICDIARRHNLFVVEDAAQGFLSYYKGRPLGSIGDFGCFSFHYTKNIICGEGGAISINRDPELARRALILWEKGTNRYDFLSGKIDKYEWVDKGSSYVPSEVSSAILWAQLEKCQDIMAQRRENFYFYHQQLQCLQEQGICSLPHVDEHCETNAHIYFLIFKSVEHREFVRKGLEKCGITTFSHYVPLHSAPAGRKYGKVAVGSEAMAVTNAVFDGLLRLPVWVGLTRTQLQSVVDALKSLLTQLD